MIVEGLSIAAGAAAVWDLTRDLARSQPLGAVVVLIFAADVVFNAAGALLDRWEAADPRLSSRKAAAPPACAAEPGR